MAESVNPRLLKSNIDQWTKILKRPMVNEKLLNRPPFKFLHDLVTLVIKSTGYLRGLYQDEEFNLANIANKEAKIAFLDKLIDAIGFITGKAIDVKATKIVAGLEVEKTNRLLNEFAKSVQDKKPFLEAVDKVKKGLKPSEKAGSDKSSETTTMSNSSKTKVTVTNNSKTKKLATNDNKAANSGAVKTTKSVATKPTEKTEVVNIEPQLEKQEEEKTKEEPEDSKEAIKSDESEDKPIGARLPKSNTFTLSKDEKLVSDEPEEPKVGQSIEDNQADGFDQISKPPTLEHPDPLGELNLDIEDEKPPQELSLKANGNDFLADLDIESDDHGDQLQPKETHPVSIETKAENSTTDDRTKLKSSKIPSSKKNVPASAAPTELGPAESRSSLQSSRVERSKSRTKGPPPVAPPSSALPRQTTARPSSSRPAPPRVMTSKALNRVLESRLEHVSDMTANASNGETLFNSNDNDEEDGDDYVINTQKLQDSLFTLKQEPGVGDIKVNGGEKGILVQQLIQTKNELEGSMVEEKDRNGTEASQPLSDSRVLRAQVQQLCQSIGSLSKALEYLHEDIDPIMLERNKWRQEYRKCLDEVSKLNNESQRELQPLGKELEQLEIENRTMAESLAMLKANVYRNNLAINKIMEKI